MGSGVEMRQFLRIVLYPSIELQGTEAGPRSAIGRAPDS